MRLYSRPGNDLTHRFPLIVEALAGLRSRSCIIDGEAVACDDNGIASFDRIRYRRHDGSVFLYAFDLIELNGDDLRRDPLEGPQGHARIRPGQGWPRHPVQRAYRSATARPSSPRLQDGARRHRVEAQGLALPFRPLARLAQDEEPDGAGGEAGGGGRLGQARSDVTKKTRTHFTFRIDTWTADGESILEHVAGVQDLQVALATYLAATQRWPGIPITLRQGRRVIEDSRRLRLV